MAIQKIRTYPSQELLTKCLPVALSDSETIMKVVGDLDDTCKSVEGYGLAANQIGHFHRIFVVEMNGELKAMINPRIVWHSDSTSYATEGCLSMPNFLVKVKRPNAIRLRYTDENLNTITQEYSGITSRVIQHEMDHLDGITSYVKSNLIHRMAAWKNKIKLDKMDKTNYPS